MSHSDADPALGHKFEAIFSLFLIVLAFLSRDNQHFVTPQIYYFFALLLILNLVAGMSLRSWPGQPWLSTMIVLANCGVVTGILAYSGGAASNLWVLYLLPVFTASVFLNPIHLAMITIGTMAFNTVFYVGEGFFSNGALQFQMGVKSGTILFAAGMTGWISIRYRRSREKLSLQRSTLNELESKVRVQQSEIDQIEKMADVGHISAGVAHDLNNPLTVILGTVKLLLEDVDTPASIRPDLERILRSATLGHTITNHLLNISKGRELVKTKQSVLELVESTLIIYEATLQESNIEVKRDYDPGLPELDLSMAQMQRVILNLLVNARGVMKTGGAITIRLKRVGLFSPNVLDAVQISVQDTGPGIPAAFMDKLFKPFNTTKSPTEGTGLGLYLSREIVMKHGGRLVAENPPEGGARFVITLPIVDAPVSTQSPEGRKILAIVDDEAGVLRGLQHFFEDKGFHVVVASSGTVAVKELMPQKPRVWFIDVRLPDGSGVDLADRIRKEDPEADVVLMSGFKEVENEGSFPTKKFLSKPLDLRDIESKLPNAA